MSKRILSLVLALVMVLGTFGTVFAADTAQKDAAEFLAEAKVLLGDDKGNLNLDLKLERRDMVILLSRLMGEEEVASEFPTSEESPTWEDARTDAYYVPFFAWAQVNKFFAGKTEKEFGPREAITAQDYAVVLLRALGYDADGHDAWKAALENAKKLGILANVEVEDATEITRGQMSVMTLNALAVNVKDSTKTLAETLEIVLPTPKVLEVVSVGASNLKEIEVEFNQKLDEATATKLDNYSVGLGFEFAELLEDGMTVKLVLKNDDAVKMVNQKTYELKVNNVENEAKTVKLSETKVKFVAIDVTIPTVKEVKALGTKAIQVVFSEPVKQSPANSTISYKIDGKVISGSVKYEYPNTVIISTNVTVGDHTLSVSGVKDFYDYAVQQPEIAFTVVEDTAAPEIVSIKSVDLNKVIVEFNEPVKAVVNGYHGSKSNLATKPISISSEKVTLTFANRMGLGNTTIYVDGVEDYSGNKADRNMVITPELDTTRPEVSEVKVKDGKDVTVTFSKSVEKDQAEKGTNYVIKNAEGKVVKGNGLNNDGNPVVGISYADKKATFSLTKALGNGTYTIEIGGIQDTTYIKNTMVPYTGTFEVGDLVKPTIIKAWTTEENHATEDGKNKYDTYLYVQFSEDMAIEGKGNVLEVIKYNYSVTDNDTWKPFPSGTTMDLVDGDVVRINLPRAEKYNIAKVRVTLVTDIAGNFMEELMAVKDVADELAKIEFTAEAIDTTTVEVEFAGKLANIDSSDFTVVGGGNTFNLSLEGYEYKNGKTVATFKLTGTNKLTESIDGYKFVATNPSSQDNFGAKVKAISVDLVDAINPTIAKNGVKVNGNKVEVSFNEDVKVNLNATSLVTVKVADKKQTVSKIEAVAGKLVITVSEVIAPDNGSDIVEVEISVGNETSKAITDIIGNPVKAVSKYYVFDDVKTANPIVDNDDLAEAAAEEAVEKAEESESQEDVDAAKVLVNALADEIVKDALQDRIDAVQAKIDLAAEAEAEAVAEATEAVEKAEESELQEDVDAAQELVDALADGSVKDGLQARIDAVQDLIDTP